MTIKISIVRGCIHGNFSDGTDWNNVFRQKDLYSIFKKVFLIKGYYLGPNLLEKTQIIIF